MSSIASPLTSQNAAGTTASSSTAAAAKPGDPLANESTFLTLLVSQLQNQDPLSPTDSNQFVSQLTSYSQLEQLIGIHSNTTALAGAATTTTTPTTPATGATTTGS
jgi:flagellar basal-body rod modification protein FlgD